MALEGRAAEVYDWALHARAQKAAHGTEAVPFFGWHYPPLFLLVAAALAPMSYILSLVVWQLTTLAAAALVIWRILPGRTHCSPRSPARPCSSAWRMAITRS
jgi:hypothetical protein